MGETAKKTVLYEEHLALHAKMVEFSGFLMPVSYDSIIQEHLCVRQHVGIFDISHMGQISVRGKDVFSFLQYLIPNNLSHLTNGKILYSALCNEQGGIVDDILVYQKSKEDYLIVVNASNTHKDFQWIASQAKRYSGSKVADITPIFAFFAVQGPQSLSLMEKIGFKVSSLGYYHFVETKFENDPVLISRTGYTGEDGFEILLPKALAVSLWNRFLKEGAPFQVKPIGLGARDTLRLEPCFSLYGHELSDSITPLEAGIGWTVDFSKEDFIGKTGLLNNPGTRRLVGFEMLDKGIPRNGYPVYKNGQKIGVVTSGSYLPSLGKNMGLALVEGTNDIGIPIEVEVRANRLKAVTVKKPFYVPLNRRKK
ncbi:MAG: glycine cleavage system aminomethyltransferase GcvT [Candidatus Aureabacteria bacterium]|nr:glycine cleavage system aminomethyltransferase GcvT [Candidatus Auribacterota bacterium]